MGAPSSLTKWIPEDDLLLRNAVETGASLESLAKGAVCFSRRFTLQELQERWHSLLYDLDTSSEASAGIIAIECELSVSNSLNVSNPPKASRNCNPKGEEYSFGKRKGDGIRSHYYAMRKRACKPCASVNLGFIAPPSSCIDTSGVCGYEDQLKHQSEQHCDSFAVGAPDSDHYGHLEMAYDTEQHVLQDLLRVDSAVAAGNFSHHIYHIGHASSVEKGPRDGVVENNCLYGYTENGYTENVSLVTTDKAGGNNTEQSFDHGCVQRGSQQIHGEHLVSLKTCSDVQETIPLQTFHTGGHYENDSVEVKPISVNDSHERSSSGFVTNHHLTSQAAEHIDSFHQNGYSTAPPDLPIWREDVPGPAMPMDCQFESNDQGVETVDDIQKMDSAGCDGATSEPKMNNEMPSDDLNNETIVSESDFMDFSSSYMDFCDDAELLFMDVDEKDVAEKPCLSGLNPVLLSSPSDAHQDDLLKSSDPRETEVLDTSFVIPDSACSVESYNACDKMQSGHDNNSSFCISEIKFPSSPPKASHTAEPLAEFIICTLNTQDPEVPCNDGVILFPSTQLPVPFLSPDSENFFKKNTVVSSSTKVISNDQKAKVGELTTVAEEQVAIAEPLMTSLEPGSSTLSKAGLRNSSSGCGVKAKSSENDPLAGFSAGAGIAVINPHSCTLQTVTLQPASVAVLKEEKTLDLGNHGKCNTSIGSFLEKSVQVSDNAELHSVRMDIDCKHYPAKQVTMQKHVSSHVEMAAGDMGCSDPAGSLLTSDQEEQHINNENGVPNFFDIESMILDMDLGPYDQESAHLTKEVSRYQSADAKKVIMRLEQGAYSYMNRAISSHGAFAIFYGRRLKYFLKESEVLLGRATEEIEVDIDLGKEGRANKVSRLQAIIKLEDNGAFILKNIGKGSIFVNGKEILSKKRTNLSSGSLLEIKGMMFVFEVNQCAVKHYISTRQGRCQADNTQFDWKPS